MSKNKSSTIYVKIESKSLGRETDFIKVFLDRNEAVEAFEKLKTSILEILDLDSSNRIIIEDE